jgi:reactive intermediate/imine deaminase
MNTSPIHSPRAPDPVGPYPHARRVGDLIFVSGMGPRRMGDAEVPGVTLDASGQVIDYDVAIQTRCVLENIRVTLEDTGSSFENIIDVLAFLTDMKRDFAAFNEVYGEHFGGKNQPFPSRTTVEVAALPQGASAPIAVELKVIATV